MKVIKTTLCLFTALLLMLMPVGMPSASAQHIDQLSMSIDFPQTYEVITRDMIENGYASEWQSGDELLAQWQNSSIYAHALAPDGTSEIVVTMTELEFPDYADMSDTEIETVMGQMRPTLEAQGIAVTDWDIFRSDTAAFLRVWYQNNIIGDARTLQYNTVHSDRVYNVSCHSYSGEITSSHEEILQSVVESIRFDDAPVIMQDSISITLPSNFPYVADSGAVLTIPEGWVKKDFTDENANLNLKLVPENENGHSILFACHDAWGELSDQDKEVSSRYYYDNGIFTMQDIAEILGVQSYQVDTVSYDDEMYFRAQSRVSQEILGQTIDTKITYLIRVYDGWLYMFHFCGIEGSDSYQEDYRTFEALVRDMTYPPSFPPVPTAATRTTTTATAVMTTTTAAASADTVGTLTPLLLVGVAVVVLIVLIFGIKAALTSPKRYNKNAEPSVICYCRYCGEKLPTDSTFCPMCGRKIGE